LSAAAICEALSRAAFSCSNEAELQVAIQAVLGDSAQREVQVPGAGRIDFLVGDVGVEVKVAGSLASVGAQLLRYLGSDLLSAIVLVTTKRAHAGLRGTLLGKRVEVHVLTGGAW
jgi:hypothetical protein